MKNITLSGTIGGLIVILFLVAASVFFEPFNYKSILLVNPEKVLTNNDSIRQDSIICSRIEILRDLENKGILLTPGEYTSHISSYYSTLVAFLIGLFVLFTIGSIFSIKITSKKEIEEIREELDKKENIIKDNLKKDIRESLSELLRDSISFKESVISAIYGRIEDDLITRSDKENIDKKLTKVEEDINLLFESFDGISEKSSSIEEIE